MNTPVQIGHSAIQDRMNPSLARQQVIENVVRVTMVSFLVIKMPYSARTTQSVFLERTSVSMAQQ